MDWYSCSSSSSSSSFPYEDHPSSASWVWWPHDDFWNRIKMSESTSNSLKILVKWADENQRRQKNIKTHFDRAPPLEWNDLLYIFDPLHRPSRTFSILGFDINCWNTFCRQWRIWNQKFKNQFKFEICNFVKKSYFHPTFSWQSIQ